MKLLFSPEAWSFRTPSGGSAEVVGPDCVMLTGEPLSYGAYDGDATLEPGWVSLDVACRTQGLDSPTTAATVMLSFYNANGSQIRRQYADAKPGKEPGSVEFSRLFEVPQGTARSVVTLALRWPQGGRVFFSAPELTPAAPPRERKARIAVTCFKAANDGDWPRRLRSLFEQAGACSPDLLCLSEALTIRGQRPREAAEPVDGRFGSLLSELAAKHNTYVTGNFLEADEGYIFNTSLLFDRSGTLAGKYRKTHLPLSEVEDGYSPGSTYPVFETDFARVGLTICWDATFPEPARRLRLSGAELMVSATIGDFWRTDAARAYENGMWFAVAGANQSSDSPLPPSRIYDPNGRLLCTCGNSGTDVFAYADIDFNQRYYKKWMSVGPGEGEWPSLFTVERRPDTYTE